MDDELGLCFQIVRTSNLVSRYLRQRRKALGLRSGESRVLECLAHTDGQLARDIARTCALDKSAMTPILRGMVERGLVTRESLPEDARASRVLLTEKGREMAAQVRAMAAEADEALAGGLSPAERSALRRALGSVAQKAGE